MPYTVLVTGANKGIGYEAVKYIAQRQPDWTILLGTRSTKNGDDAIAKMKSSAPDADFSNVKVLQLDITDSSSLHSAYEHIKSTYRTLDVLLHNSGISELNGDSKHPEIFEVNIRGAKASIETFYPLLPKDGKGIIDVVSSEVAPWYLSELPSEARDPLDTDHCEWEQNEKWMADWLVFANQGQEKAENTWVSLEKGAVGSMYCASKAILNPYLRNFSRTHTDIKLVVTCPGYCATDLNQNQGHRPASKGGESVAWPLFNEFENGKFYQDGVKKPFRYDVMPEWNP